MGVRSFVPCLQADSGPPGAWGQDEGSGCSRTLEQSDEERRGRGSVFSCLESGPPAIRPPTFYYRIALGTRHERFVTLAEQPGDACPGDASPGEGESAWTRSPAAHPLQSETPGYAAVRSIPGRGTIRYGPLVRSEQAHIRRENPRGDHVTERSGARPDDG